MSEERQTIRISPPSTRERKKRQREMALAVAGFLAVALLTWAELTLLGVDSYLFLALFNINFILLVLVLFIVVRNGVKLLLERRRKVLGARLRTRLVLAFISLSLVPTALLFLVSLLFVQTSVDYWFKTQVEQSMAQALEVGQAYYARAEQRLDMEARVLADKAGPLAWESRRAGELLAAARAERKLALAGVLTGRGERLHWLADAEVAALWPQVQAGLDLEDLARRPRFVTQTVQGPGMDYMVGLMPLERPAAKGQDHAAYLVLAEPLGQGLMFKLDGIVRGVNEYQNLQALKRPLKAALYFILGVLTLLIVLGAMWFGFRLSKELTAPIQALALGTERIAQGDLSVRLEDQSADEFGVLVASFNQMARDLEGGRRELEGANAELASTNRELEERRAYTEALLDTIGAGVVSVDAERRITTVNKAAEGILAASADQLAGLPVEALLPPRYQDLLEEIRERIGSAPGAQWQRQLDVTIAGQEKKILVSVVGLGPGEGKKHSGLVAVFEDVTELDKMQRMAAWREVAKRIAHEIKNPLTPIKLSAQRLERKFGPEIEDEAFGQCTRVIVEQVEQLGEMVREFTTFAKLPEVTPRLGRLEPLLEEVVTTFRVSLPRIRWELDAAEGLPELSMDREAVRRALVNLFTNAAEALEGTVAPMVRVTARHDPEMGLVRLEVADNGPGLTPEERSKLFEPYFSGKKHGTGLGLTIVKSIVNDHRGYVRVREPEDGAGTVFVVELPA